MDFKFIFNRETLEDVARGLKDLAKIDTMIKIKIDHDNILFYSKAGTMHSIKAFKSFIYNYDDLIESDEKIVMDFIILNGKNFVDNLSLMLKKEGVVAGKLSYNEGAKCGNILHLSNGTMKFKFISGDYTQIKDISKNEIDLKMNPDNANFNFSIDKETFTDIKKLSKMNKSEIINFKTKKNKVSFFDKKWNVHVDEITDEEVDDNTYTFNNKYIQSINLADEIVVNVFDTFILIKDDFVTLLIGLELSDF